METVGDETVEPVETVAVVTKPVSCWGRFMACWARFVTNFDDDKLLCNNRLVHWYIRITYSWLSHIQRQPDILELLDADEKLWNQPQEAA